MDLNKVKVIIKKEWAEVFKNRMVLFSVIFMPLVFTALPLIMLYATRDAGLSELDTEMPAQFAQLCSEGLTGGECFQVYITSQMMLLFMMMPLIIPVNIAAYSIVGEKTTHSLEPLLATPITTGELVTGKNLASVIPAVIATWLSFGLFAVGALLITSSSALLRALLDPMWLLAVLLLGPLLAILSVNFSIMVSSRVNDPRVAEQLSTVVILPLMALFLGQIFGLFFINTTLILWTAMITLLIDGVVLYLAVKLFQRETILTRWK
ncbi:MAG: ABC transporter permease subunit [Anaerolineales bacterium]|jgi:ABC-2 type transport system permease protein|nr:ABC transporter permease subunit [Anaerolineales bacterium]